MFSRPFISPKKPAPLFLLLHPDFSGALFWAHTHSPVGGPLALRVSVALGRGQTRAGSSQLPTAAFRRSRGGTAVPAPPPFRSTLQPTTSLCQKACKPSFSSADINDGNLYNHVL